MLSWGVFNAIQGGKESTSHSGHHSQNIWRFPKSWGVPLNHPFYGEHLHEIHHLPTGAHGLELPLAVPFLTICPTWVAFVSVDSGDRSEFIHEFGIEPAYEVGWTTKYPRPWVNLILHEPQFRPFGDDSPFSYDSSHREVVITYPEDSVILRGRSSLPWWSP